MDDNQLELLRPFLDDIKTSGTDTLDAELQHEGASYRIRLDKLNK